MVKVSKAHSPSYASTASLVHAGLKKRFENPKYLTEYAGEGRSYEERVWEYTVQPKFVQQMLKVLRPGWKPVSLFDVGAATGVVQEHFRKLLKLTTVQGIEIAENIWNKRVTESVALGNALDLAVRKIPGLVLALAGYDLVILNCTMYLNERELHKLFSRVLPRLMHARSLVFIPFLYDASMYMVSEYLGNGYGWSGEDVAPLLCRPKAWWLQMLVGQGFIPLGEDSSTVVVAELNPKKAHAMVLPLTGRAQNCRVVYPGPTFRPRRGMKAPFQTDTVKGQRVFVWKSEPTPDGCDVYEYWQEVDNQGSARKVVLGASVVSEYMQDLADIAAFFRTGEVGMTANVSFRPISRYGFHPGVVTEFDEKTQCWNVFSDLHLSMSTTQQHAMQMVHPNWFESPTAGTR